VKDGGGTEKLYELTTAVPEAPVGMEKRESAKEMKRRARRGRKVGGSLRSVGGRSDL
jgi:hypothetical protein